ncbi:Rho GTPase-activating protein domain,WW domain,MyTH4 domain,Rho GTPase activation protein [Cinara cedri]|uniref:Rho GTPase-activating protein 39 n=1 Tax=Cinara cedri TaxID=506608 RepID=A0A5E4MBD6_9HEMI|nr:Rho GTPase-activating protein domain,WW domain,MyTH4 domain,Rho GTPase activation protein [Cinara cedri]
MTSERVEWVEIIEPRTKEPMYANLTTGECVWDAPVGVPVKKKDNNQWWELFDSVTDRFYYYNTASQKTVWHRPPNSDIIPLAKLQTLKQNTEPAVNDENDRKQSKESVSTQTSGRSRMVLPLSSSNQTVGNVENVRTFKLMDPVASTKRSVDSETQTSPITPRRSHHHHHHHHKHQQQSNTPSRGRRGNQPNVWYNRTAYSQDSGRSSDSSCVSIQSSSGKDATVGLSMSASTPLFRKKISQPPTPQNNLPIQRSSSNASQYQLLLGKQKSFDTDISIGGGYSLGHDNRNNSCSRPRPPAVLSSSLSNSQICRSQSFAQKSIATKTSIEVEEEDSMHEKYLAPSGLLGMPPRHGKKSVESTPLSSRKWHSHSDTGSPTASKSRPPLTPEYANFAAPPPPPIAPSHSNSKSSLTQLVKHTKNSKDVGLSSSDEDDSRENDNSSSSVSSSPPTAGKIDQRFRSDIKPVDSHSKVRPVSNHSSSSSQHGGPIKKSVSPAISDQKQTPLYSNLDMYEGRILPLHQYILEQAKLSGSSYRFGDAAGTCSEDDDAEIEDLISVMGTATGYDSDEFADDEGAISQGDQSSSPSPSNASSRHYLRDELDYDHLTAMRTSQPRSYTNDTRVSDYVVEPSSNQHYYNTVTNTLSSQRSINLVTPSMSDPFSSSAPTLPLETQHTSLRRRKDQRVQSPAAALYSPIMERNELVARYANSNRGVFHPSLSQDARSSSPAYYYEQTSRTLLNRDKKNTSESDIEKYAQDNLNIHKKGIFRKKFSVRDMLSWSKDPIRKPMLVLSDKALKKEACDLFKLVQTYMSDRKAKLGMTLNSVALEICMTGFMKPTLRDELYIQICRQTTENPRKESLRRGWELLAICLSFFPPSPKLQKYLESYMERHRDPGLDSYATEVGRWPVHVQVSHYASIATKRLHRMGVDGKKAVRRPTLEDIEQARMQIFRPSLFGNTINEIIDLQKERFPHYKLPWVQTTLSELVLRHRGDQTEGIFRVPADMDEVMALKSRLDVWEVPGPEELTDAHTPASLLKLWYRELYEPLVPDHMYAECIAAHQDARRAIAIIHRLPPINKAVLAYLIHFLQLFTKPEVVHVTKMDASNLAMVMAPNCLRCTSVDPRVIFDNARKEMAFMRLLILHFDASFMEGVF